MKRRQRREKKKKEDEHEDEDEISGEDDDERSGRRIIQIKMQMGSQAIKSGWDLTQHLPDKEEAQAIRVGLNPTSKR